MDEPESNRPLLLSLSDLTKRFGSVTAVWNLSLNIHSGDFISIFGPNGAGKSTLLRLIADLSQPSSGQICFADENPGLRNRMGYVSHQSLLYADLTGLENLVFFGRLYGVSEPHQRADDLLKKMGLRYARHQMVRTYSSGMKQRLTIARALIDEPSLLLLDEPYAGLDQHGCRLLSDQLNRLLLEGRTVLLITHNLNDGLALCNRVMIMVQGQSVFQAGSSSFDSAEFEQMYFHLVEGRAGTGADPTTG